MCTLKTSYRDFDKDFYQDIREKIVNQVYEPNIKQLIRVILTQNQVSNAIETKEVKQKRAQGGCLGTKSR